MVENQESQPMQNNRDVGDQPLVSEFGIACNYEGDSFVRRRALCFVTFTNPGNASDRVQVWVRSRSGRAVIKFVKIESLNNFRAKWIPPHVRECKRIMGSPWWTKPEAIERAESYQRRFGKSH